MFLWETPGASASTPVACRPGESELSTGDLYEDEDLERPAHSIDNSQSLLLIVQHLIA